MTRLLIVGDPGLLMTRMPLGAFVAAAEKHPAIELLALCDAARRNPWAPSRRMRRALRRSIRRIFNPWVGLAVPGLGVLRNMARDHHLALITPPGRDLNTPAFREDLRTRWKPDAVLSLGCRQIFRPELLAVFSTAINFHNGLLPDYRGLSATSWSLYNGETRTGYSFHHLTQGIDEGAVIVEGAVPVHAGLDPQAAELAKCVDAARAAEAVMDAIASKAPGRPQTGGSYYSRLDRQRICRIDTPETLTSAEIRRRLHCFGLLDLRIGDQWWEITELSERGGPSFRTADGVLAARRAMFLPPALYRIYRALRA